MGKSMNNYTKKIGCDALTGHTYPAACVQSKLAAMRWADISHLGSQCRMNLRIIGTRGFVDQNSNPNDDGAQLYDAVFNLKSRIVDGDIDHEGHVRFVCPTSLGGSLFNIAHAIVVRDKLQAPVLALMTVAEWVSL